MTSSAIDNAPVQGDELWTERFWTAFYPPAVPKTIDDELARWPSLTALYEADSRTFADRPGYVSIGSTLSYGDALDEAKRFAAFLQSRGIGRGDRVALMMPNCLQYPIALFGTLFAGAIVVNCNPLYTASELNHQLRDSGAVAVVVMNMFARTLSEARDGTDVKHVIVTAMGDMLGGLKGVAISAMMKHVAGVVPKFSIDDAITWPRMRRSSRSADYRPVENGPEDIAFLQYTGGTSGVAKGAILTHRNIVANVLQGRAWVTAGLDRNEAFTNVTLLPLYHIYSLTANLLMFGGIGGRNIMIANPRDTKRVQKMLRHEQFDGFAGLNTLFASFLENPEFCARDFSKLRLTVAGGMATQKDIAERWQKMTGKPLVEGYGLTECSPVVTIGYVDFDHPEKMGFTGRIGLPVPSTEVRMRREDGSWAGIDEPGELCVRGPQVMRGYWNRDDETAKVMIGDGWLATGDVGIMDARGEIKLVDRIKDMILVSGFNVYPNEIEDVVAAHPGVREVAAIGVPDPKAGERVKIIVVKRDASLTEEEILAWCRKRLTGYKLPRAVEFRTEELPKTPVGKVLRRALK
jgi:long-chain acyl-CoA synthetase